MALGPVCQAQTLRALAPLFITNHSDTALTQAIDGQRIILLAQLFDLSSEILVGHCELYCLLCI